MLLYLFLYNSSQSMFAVFHSGFSDYFFLGFFKHPIQFVIISLPQAVPSLLSICKLMTSKTELGERRYKNTISLYTKYLFLENKKLWQPL